MTPSEIKAICREPFRFSNLAARYEDLVASSIHWRFPPLPEPMLPDGVALHRPNGSVSAPIIDILKRERRPLSCFEIMDRWPKEDEPPKIGVLQGSLNRLWRVGSLTRRRRSRVECARRLMEYHLA